MKICWFRPMSCAFFFRKGGYHAQAQLFAIPRKRCKSIIIWPWLKFVWRKELLIAWELRATPSCLLVRLTPWAGSEPEEDWVLGNCTSRKKNLIYTRSEMRNYLLKFIYTRSEISKSYLNIHWEFIYTGSEIKHSLSGLFVENLFMPGLKL